MDQWRNHGSVEKKTIGKEKTDLWRKTRFGGDNKRICGEKLDLRRKQDRRGKK